MHKNLHASVRETHEKEGDHISCVVLPELQTEDVEVYATDDANRQTPPNAAAEAEEFSSAAQLRLSPTN